MEGTMGKEGRRVRGVKEVRADITLRGYEKEI